MLDGVLAETGVPIAGRVTLFGFSRGAQEALRFALFFPDRVQAVAALSAGTYTLPLRDLVTPTGTTLAAPMPYGIADAETATGRAVDPSKLGRVRFLIGVGAADNRAGDVPRQWDPFVGSPRRDRAERFAGALRQLGIPTETAVIPGAGHEVNDAMLERVTGFIARVAAEPQA
jgi:pimeloyl-ACP methyl ester carboxylesterase